MCGSPNTASIAAHLAASIPCRSGATVKNATWNSSMQQWQLAGVCGAHKDSVPAEARSEDFGSFDALVVSDAAVMRPGSAGYINFEASSQGGGLLACLSLFPCIECYSLVPGLSTSATRYVPSSLRICKRVFCTFIM